MMSTNSVIVNASDCLQCYNDFQHFNDNVESLTEVEIEYQSENSSSLSYTDLSYTLSMDVSSSSTGSAGYSSSYNSALIVEVEPKDQLRFRYKSEKGFHGGLKPVVRLVNYESPDDIWIKATLYTCGKCPTLHVLELDGKQCVNGVCWLQLSSDFTTKFSPLSICMKKKDEITNVLKERIKQEYKAEKKQVNEKDLEKAAKERMKTFNSNSAMLCFEAFYNKNENAPICDMVFSRPIYNQKCTLAGELKITRLSSFSGKASGDEDMILLCEKIRKDDIDIIFSFQDDNINWEERAQFNPADVHHQVAIPFKTPRFIENREQEVFIRLHRKSDGRDGEPRAFYYKPCDDFDGKPMKRKRPNPPEDISMSPSSLQSTSSISTPSTSTASNENSFENAEFDRFLNSILENLPDDNLNIDDALPFEDVPVIPEGILDLSPLNISMKGKNVNQKRTLEHTSSIDLDLIKMLRAGIINFLNDREYDTFMKFLPALLSIKDENGNSLLHLLVIEKSENLHWLLKMLQAAPNGLLNEANTAKMTPLHTAIKKGLWKVVRILYFLGADPNIKDNNGNTCTHLAAMYSFPQCLKEMLVPTPTSRRRKFIPAVNVLNYEGLAPLHLSVKNNSKKCAELLIQAKADINICDGKCGKTPLHMAYEKDSELVALLLSTPGIDLNAEEFNGNTPTFYLPKVQKNIIFVPKPTECCIELSSESSNSNEDDCVENNEEKCIVSDKVSVKEKDEEEKGEDKFCKTLDSNKLWKKMGYYIMSRKEVEMIELMDTTPTKTILNELKKHHGQKYPEKLEYILSDTELKEFAHLLII